MSRVQVEPETGIEAKPTQGRGFVAREADWGAREGVPLVSPPAADDPREVRLPAERFLWAMLDVPSSARRLSGKAAPLAPGLLPALADDLHVDVDDLVAVGLVTGDGRLLCCAIEHEVVDASRATALTLGPATVPACVGDACPGVQPGAFDLLVGPHAPLRAVRRHQLRHAIAALAVAGCAALAAIGLNRRAAAWDTSAEQARSRAALLVVHIDPQATLADLPYLAEQARTRWQAEASLGSPEPIAPVLGDLLSSWPEHAPPASLSVADQTILATVLLESDTGAFLEALEAPSGWRAREPRISALAEATQVTIVFERGQRGAMP